MMDPTCSRILEIIREHNRLGTEICQSDLFEAGIAAPPTVQKRISEMLSEGTLIGLSVQTPHGTKRLLFVPEFYTSAEGIVTHRLMGMMNYQLRRIADSMERREGRTVQSGPGDGRVQVQLWSEDGEGERCPTSARSAAPRTSTRTGCASSAPNAGR